MNDLARQIVENPLYQETLEKLKMRYYQNCRDAAPKSDEREYWLALHDGIDDIDRHFRIILAGDSISKIKLDVI